MKISIYTALFFSLLMYTQGRAQTSPLTDSTGLPGDNFSLQGALEFFKKSSSLEDFEKRLNAENNDVNNLDLNGDQQTDYIKVTDRTEKDIHAVILQVNVNSRETQDLAVIEIEKTGDQTAVLQIVGDEELYGKDAIAEPLGAEEKADGTGKGPFAPAVKPAFVVVNVWYWPVVTYMYQPNYVVWVSPWYWDYYPSYWHPWHVRPWYVHHHHCSVYRPHYNVVYVYRNQRAHNVYHTHRRTSPTVSRTYAPAQARHAALVKQQPAGRSREGQSVGTATGRQKQKDSDQSQNRTRQAQPVTKPAEPAKGETRRPVQSREISPQAPPSAPARSNNQPAPQPRQRKAPEAAPQRSPRRESPQARPQRQQRAPQSAPRSAPRQQGGGGGQRRGGR
jgi:hypothetical protein